ncbi:hypothetical protein L6536_001149 [Salmonella enterica subsp. enterica serovar Johannesburg]|nr:hypothetical protein [Salmonella enterica subsp. enterica serovar Johannesburg]EIU7950713.1 hypothetical protein [Salmonella enterica subsp. enterica serovar Johannesburg]EIU8280863.1 hypothetical protein [Salmonella enterica subsp. enterica serovar Johannesburg]
MKSLIIDVAGLAGFGAMVGGIFLKFGAAGCSYGWWLWPAAVGAAGGQENKTC